LTANGLVEDTFTQVREWLFDTLSSAVSVHYSKLPTMNIDVTIYRQRFGMFGSGRGFKGYSPNNDYSPYVPGTDVHLRMWCTCVLVTILAMTCAVVNNGIITIITTSHRTLFPVNHFIQPPLANAVYYAYEPLATRHYILRDHIL